jgi:hypothetical protein
MKTLWEWFEETTQPFWGIASAVLLVLAFIEAFRGGGWNAFGIDAAMSLACLANYRCGMKRSRYSGELN